MHTKLMEPVEVGKPEKQGMGGENWSWDLNFTGEMTKDEDDWWHVMLRRPTQLSKHYKMNTKNIWKLWDILI